ncbi:XRE family transcriptional regulator [Aegicerativicinus sediminis]|uniref:XRE family transcriptional regulator n=1 Tax=Aegicerativicinus sediminis TaxID=2893202 RepID=UPI0021CDEEBA|nr:helix-turn-helix transcriptional regulator [Aegicerativicinus sediminis]
MNGKEIKRKRESLGLTQEEMGKLIGMSKNTIYNYENGGKIPSTKIPILVKFFNDRIEQGKFPIIRTEGESPNDISVKDPLGFIKNKNGLNYEELPNGKWRVKVPKVPYRAYASFIEVFSDEYELHRSFSTTYFTVDHPGKGKYVAFTVGNDSMNGGGINDTPDGAEVLGRELQRHHWKDGFRDCEYGWIIVSSSGIMHKDIKGPDGNGTIICQSRNPSPEYHDFELELNDVHSIWKVIKRTF